VFLESETGGKTIDEPSVSMSGVLISASLPLWDTFGEQNEADGPSLLK